MADGCELCQLEKVTPWYYEDETFAILECYMCWVPMAVLKRHDATGSPEAVQRLTDQRAQAVLDRLTSQGVAGDRLSARGLGATMPIAPNTTAANKAKNRRVILTIAPRNN